MTTNEEIRAAVETYVETFLEDWNRGDWMVANGEWASAQWERKREAYTETVEALDEAIAEVSEVKVPDADRADARSLAEVRAALEAAIEALEAAEKAGQALDGQVTPGESDYIAEGVIDPDGVANTAQDLHVGSNWQGWDCTEGWSAYRAGDALYMHWFRAARGQRHERALWVLVDDAFFEAAEVAS